MLKPTVKRGLLLDFLPKKIFSVENVNEHRVFKFFNSSVGDGDIIYVMSRELRLEDNWAVIFGVDLAKKYDKNFKILIKLPEYSNAQESFLQRGLANLELNLAKNNIDFEYYNTMPNDVGALIIDFNPIADLSELLSLKTFQYPIFEVDSHNVVPARSISDKQEYSAATLRRKIYANIAEFLTEYPIEFDICNSEGNEKLHDFISNKLDSYAELKNIVKLDMTSNMSPYLHFGFIASQRVAIEVLNSSAGRENIEAYLEELIVRKELADNFCLYGKSYKTLDGIYDWAKATLNAHKTDIRTYLYDLQAFESANTHDELWNQMQDNLVKKGKIHGYARMYWAKKILEWSKSPEEALEIGIFLNDKYAIDGIDPNGYVGLLWSIGGLHDRPFTNRLVTGRIRYMGKKKEMEL